MKSFFPTLSQLILMSPAIFAGEVVPLNVGHLDISWSKSQPDKIFLSGSVRTQDSLFLSPLHCEGFWGLKADQLAPAAEDTMIRYTMSQSDKYMDLTQDLYFRCAITQLPQSGTIDIDENITVTCASGTERSRPIHIQWDGKQEFVYNSTYYEYKAIYEGPNSYSIYFSNKDVDRNLKDCHFYNSMYQRIPVEVLTDDDKSPLSNFNRRLKMKERPQSMELECWKDVKEVSLPLRVHLQIPASLMALMQNPASLSFGTRAAAQQEYLGLEATSLIEKLKFDLDSWQLNEQSDKSSISFKFGGPSAKGYYLKEKTAKAHLSPIMIDLKPAMDGAECSLYYGGEDNSNKEASCTITLKCDTLPPSLSFNNVVTGELYYNDIFSDVYPIAAKIDSSFYFEDILFEYKYLKNDPSGQAYQLKATGDNLDNYRNFSLIVDDAKGKRGGISYIDRLGKNRGKHYRFTNKYVSTEGITNSYCLFSEPVSEIQIMHRSKTAKIEHDLQFKIDLPVLRKGAETIQTK